MRDVDAKEITKTVTHLFLEANFYLTDDVLESLKKAKDTEESPVGKEVLEQLIKMRISLLKSRYHFARTAVLL